MNAGCTDSKQEHSKKHPKDLSPSNRRRLQSMRALMFQIHDKVGRCAALWFGFRLECLESI